MGPLRTQRTTFHWSPNLPVLFSRNKLPSLIYRRTICTDLCLVCRMMDRSDAPAIAALVACPALRNARRTCPHPARPGLQASLPRARHTQVICNKPTLRLAERP
jgi:hypothetical protein